MEIAGPGRRKTGAYWSRILAVNVAAAIVVTLGFSGVGLRTPPRVMLEGFAVALLFASIIGSMLALVLPRVPHAGNRGFMFPLAWIVRIGTMVAIAVAGSFTAILILSAIGYLKGAGIIATWMSGSLKASIVITLTFGIFVTVLESMRGRLNETTVALRTMERDEAEARRLAAEAQLASIESRVQPHFLFNTLNSIAALVHDDPAGAERMTTQLASLMRSSLDSTSKPLVPLEEELRVVAAYLAIEGVRFGSRLRYTIDVPDAARTVQVPRLAVQTIVENSVKYAVSPRREGGSIAVRAVTRNGCMEIAVEDDGAGFDASAASSGHGLALVRERLAMTLGADAALQIDSRPGYSRVAIRLPRAATES